MHFETKAPSTKTGRIAQGDIKHTVAVSKDTRAARGRSKVSADFADMHIIIGVLRRIFLGIVSLNKRLNRAFLGLQAPLGIMKGALRRI